jgi:hypothetical protein
MSIRPSTQGPVLENCHLSNRHWIVIFGRKGLYLFQYRAHFFSFLFQIIVVLYIDPEFRRISKILGKPERRIRRYASLALENFTDSRLVDMGALGELICRDSHRNEKIFLEYLAWMYVGYAFHG